MGIRRITKRVHRVLRDAAEFAAADQAMGADENTAAARCAGGAEHRLVARLRARRALRRTPVRALNVLDDGNREWLGIDVATSIPSRRAIRLMEQLIAGSPMRNGSELTSHAFVDWAKDNGIALRFIEPGKPNQNAYIERFNRTYRDEVLSAYLFESTHQVQQVTDDWLIEYNEQRPHDSLGRVLPLTLHAEGTT